MTALAGIASVFFVVVYVIAMFVLAAKAIDRFVDKDMRAGAAYLLAAVLMFSIPIGLMLADEATKAKQTQEAK